MLLVLLNAVLNFAFENPKSSNGICKFKKEMSEEVCKQHIILYVNEYSVDLGFNGEYITPSKHLYKIAQEKK